MAKEKVVSFEDTKPARVAMASSRDLTKIAQNGVWFRCPATNGSGSAAKPRRAASAVCSVAFQAIFAQNAVFTEIEQAKTLG